MGERLLGVDGCPGGWVGVWEDLNTGAIGVQLSHTATEFLTGNWALIAIDIPIGLPDSGARLADLEARKFLKPKRHNSVFPAPVRAAVSARDYRTACEVTQSIDGRKVSKQAFAIFDRIAEVDAFMLAGTERVFEMHPEVSFAAMNDGCPLNFPKRSAQGRDERQSLLATAFRTNMFNELRSVLPKRVCADDDLADAMAALWTAKRLNAGYAFSLPSPAPRDSQGIVTAIWY